MAIIQSPLKSLDIFFICGLKKHADEPEYSRRHRLPLVLTLVLNFGHSAWKGPQSFIDMADYSDDDLVQLAEQGKIVLIDPYRLDGGHS